MEGNRPENTLVLRDSASKVNGESGKPRRILQAIDRWQVSVRSSADLTSVSFDAGAGVGGFAAGMNGTFNGLSLNNISSLTTTKEPPASFERLSESRTNRCPSWSRSCN